MLEIAEATTPAQLAAVRALMKDYLNWHYQRHARDRDLIDRYFDGRSFSDELAGLPGAFAAPRGRLLLATLRGQAAGSVALRDMGGGACEIKRLFVSAAAQGQGVGRALLARLVSEAKSIGYRRMRLDTGPLQYEAHSLYRQFGFKAIAPYYDLEPEMRSWLTFMELDLCLPTNTARTTCPARTPVIRALPLPEELTP